MPLKLTKRGKVWWIRGTVCGVSIYRTTKLESQKLADIMRKRIEDEIALHHALGELPPKTFDDACGGYLLSGGSDRFLLPLRKKFGAVYLKDIKQNDLDEAATKLYPGTRPETRNRQCYTPFIAVWNFAAENDWAKPRKWRRPRKPKGTNAVHLRSTRSGQAPVDYERAAQFVSTMSPAPAMALTALFYTGLRPIEAFALRSADIDIGKRWLVVRSSKTGEPRGVPLHSFLCAWLGPLVDRAKADGGMVFRTPRDAPYTEGSSGLKTAILGARRRSGIKDVSPYTGRHTVSTGLVIAGVHPHIKDQVLGHAADSMSRHYTNVPQAPLIAAIDLLPVPDTWRALPWVEKPQEWWSKLADGTGRRRDLNRH